jgi:hypothetical protein
MLKRGTERAVAIRSVRHASRTRKRKRKRKIDGSNRKRGYRRNQSQSRDTARQCQRQPNETRLHPPFPGQEDRIKKKLIINRQRKYNRKIT